MTPDIIISSIITVSEAKLAPIDRVVGRVVEVDLDVLVVEVDVGIGVGWVGPWRTQLVRVVEPPEPSVIVVVVVMVMAAGERRQRGSVCSHWVRLT